MAAFRVTCGFLLARGASALFKVDGVDSVDEHMDGVRRNCVWATQTSSASVMQCLDGSMCNVEEQGWNCCGLKFRAKCPATFTACNERTPDGHDFTCKMDCTDFGGARSCDSIHPCAWSTSSAKACQELTFGFGQYTLSKIGADGCKHGWKPIVDEVTCRDAQNHAQKEASVPFGYAEKDDYALCNFCASCDPPTIHLHTNHQDHAKWICKKDPESTVLALTRSKSGCVNDNPESGLGPRDQFGRGCGDYVQHTDWCGNHDDPDFHALTDCCACAGKEADRRRRGNGKADEPTTGEPSERRRGRGPGTLDLDSVPPSSSEDFEDDE